MSTLDKVDKDELIEYVLENYFDEMKEAIQEQMSGA